MTLDHAYTPATPAAARAAARLIPADARTWVHRPHHLSLAAGAAPAVLGFGVARVWPPLGPSDASPPRVDLRPFDRFLADHVRPFRDDPVPSLDEHLSALVRGLSWLSRALGAPVSHWHHYGHDGLLYEFFWGFHPVAPPCGTSASAAPTGTKATDSTTRHATRPSWVRGSRRS